MIFPEVETPIRAHDARALAELRPVLLFPRVLFDGFLGNLFLRRRFLRRLLLSSLLHGLLLRRFRFDGRARLPGRLFLCRFAWRDLSPRRRARGRVAANCGREPETQLGRFLVRVADVALLPRVIWLQWLAEDFWMRLEEEPPRIMVIEVEHVAGIGLRQPAMAADDHHVLV